MESISTPRISGRIINSFVGRNVIVVGKVVQLRGDQATLDADGNVTVNLTRDTHLTPGNGAQIIGKVLPDLSVKVMTSMDLGTNVDYAVCNAVVDVTHQCKEVFIFEDDGRGTN